MKSPRVFFTFAALLMALQQSVIHAFAQPSTPRDSTWITNGAVTAVAYLNGLIYIGGDFTYVGPNTGHGAALSTTTTGAPDLKFPKVNGPIYVVTPDDADGWYIGGSFTKVGDFARNWLAHIKADGTVDSAWDPNPAGNLVADATHIHAIVVRNSTVYVGGSFTSIGGQQRRGLAALNASTGLATSWNPNASGIVRAIAINGETVYAGGDFASIGGHSRKFFAAIDMTTGNATAWNPSLNARVHAIVLNDTLVFVGGLFSSAGGQARNRLAAFSITSGQVMGWNPNASGSVFALALKGSTLYVGGSIASIGTSARNKIAALSIHSSIPLSWNPGANNLVRAIYVNGSTVYVSGDFTKIGGQSRYRIAALDETTGKATAWISRASAPVLGLATNSNGSVVYAGGEFRSIGGQWRNRLAALNPATGSVTAWWNSAATINGSIHAIAISGSNVYIGGAFTLVGHSERNRIAAINAATGAVTEWDPNANGHVHAITIDNATVYVGGKFTAIGGQTRNLLAALDINTGLAKTWNPNVGGSGVYTILANGATIYAGGDFYKIGDFSSQALAAIDANTGLVTAWNPNLNASSIVYDMALDGATLYIGGEFNTIKGQTRNRLAAVDLTTANPTAWNPNANGTVRTLALSGANVYAGGDFTSLGAQTRNYLAAINKSTGIPTGWNPNPNNFGTGQSLAAGGSSIFAGGTFTTVGGNVQDYFAQFGNFAANNNPPSAPSAINQYIQHDNTTIPEGGTINANLVVFKTTISDPDDESVKLQIELRKITEAFTGAPTQTSNLANSGTAVSITTDTLAAAGYKWRYRVMDARGSATAWVEFGTPGNTDFAINSVPLPAVAAYGNIPDGDRSHPDEITYIFSGRAGDIHLSYQAYDIDTPDEVKILLNDAHIANMPLTANNQWSGDLGVVLPDALVNNASPNLVIFDNIKNPPGVLQWGARQVSIENCFKLPSSVAYGKILGGDQTHADRVIYWFLGKPGDVNLFYEAYDINDTDELDVIFNGAKIRDEAITANNGWSTIRTLLLPDALVNDTEANIVIFNNTKNPPNALNWGVRNVSVAFTVVNTPPVAPTALKQLQTDGITAIPEGGTTSEKKVVFKATVSDPENDQVKLQIELRKTTEAFTGTPNLQSSLVNSGTSATIAAENLIFTDYKWRFRAMDASGLTNAWAEFGTPSNTDFTVIPPIIIPSIDVPIYPIADSSQLVGDEFGITVYVGTDTKPITRLFGVAFVLEFTQTNYIDVVTPYDNSIIPLIGFLSPIVSHQVVDEEAGKVSIGMSRAYGDPNVNGYGAVLRVRFVSRYDTPAGTQVKFSISNVAAFDSLGNPISLVAGAEKNITLNSSPTRTVWPGDTNNDRHVNPADILPLGLYWGATGPIRPNASMQFIGQPCPSWAQPLVTYADANGDGKIDQIDVVPIGLHWGKRYTAPSLVTNSEVSTPTSANIAPEIIPLEPAPDQEFLMRIKVTEVSDLFGLAFELLYDQPQLLNVLAVEPDSLFGNDVVFYSNTDAAIGKIAVGISRKAGQAGLSGSVSVVRVKAKIAPNAIVGANIKLSLQNVVANDANGVAMSLSPQAVSLTISSTTGIDSNGETALPANYRLLQNHPNPFNAGTLIKYEIPQAGPVSVKIYNLTGQEILEMVNAVQSPGRYQINWNGRDSHGETVPSGVYICRIQAGSFVQTQRMIMVR